MVTPQDLELRGMKYSDARNILTDFSDSVGFGEDGRVWRTNRLTVIKVFERESSYQTELSCYQRLKDERITNLHGLEIPELVDSDDELLVIEMTLIVPPWLLDFGKCYIDKPPPYDSKERTRETLKHRRVFKDNFPKLQAILWKLQQIGIYYVDARPSNVRFSISGMEPEEEDDADESELDYTDYEDMDDGEY